MKTLNLNFAEGLRSQIVLRELTDMPTHQFETREMINAYFGRGGFCSYEGLAKESLKISDLLRNKPVRLD